MSTFFGLTRKPAVLTEKRGKSLPLRPLVTPGKLESISVVLMRSDK